MQETPVRVLGQEGPAGEGIGYPFQYSWASRVAQLVKNPPAMWETWVRSDTANHLTLLSSSFIHLEVVIKIQTKTLQENYTQISFMKVKVRVAQSCPTLYDPMDYTVHDSPGQNTGVGSLFLLQGTFPTQGLNPGLPHCRWILYQLSHKGSPRILEWVAYPFSSRSSWPRNRIRVSCIVGGFFTNWAMREAHLSWTYM